MEWRQAGRGVLRGARGANGMATCVVDEAGLAGLNGSGQETAGSRDEQDCDAEDERNGGPGAPRRRS